MSCFRTCTVDKEFKILELKESYKRLDVRSTIDKPPESEMKDEPPEFVSDSSLWTKNESNELFARLVQDTKMIAFPKKLMKTQK